MLGYRARHAVRIGSNFSKKGLRSACKTNLAFRVNMKSMLLHNLPKQNATRPVHQRAQPVGDFKDAFGKTSPVQKHPDTMSSEPLRHELDYPEDAAHKKYKLQW